jgi:hypothetical protein
VGSQRHAPAALPLEKRRGTHCTGDWVGPGPVWTGAENLASTGNRSQDRTGHSESPYRLRCPGVAELLTYFRPLNVRSSASTGWFTWRYFMYLILLLTHLRGLRTRPTWFVAVTIRNPFLGLMDWDTWVTCSCVCSQPYELTKSHLTCKLPCSWIASRTTVLSCSSAVWCFRYEVQEHDCFVRIQSFLLLGSGGGGWGNLSSDPEIRVRGCSLSFTHHHLIYLCVTWSKLLSLGLQ